MDSLDQLVEGFEQRCGGGLLVLRLPAFEKDVFDLQLVEPPSRPAVAEGSTAAGIRGMETHQPCPATVEGLLDLGAQGGLGGGQTDMDLEEGPLGRGIAPGGGEGFEERQDFTQGQGLALGDTQHVDGAGNGERCHLGEPFALELDQDHLVRILPFGKREGDGRAAVSHRRAPHPLRSVEMAEGDIGQVVGEEIGGQCVLVATEDPTLAHLAEPSVGHVAMAGGKQRLPRPTALPCGGDYVGIDLPHPLDQRVGLFVQPTEVRQIGDPEIGHRRHPGGHLPLGVVERGQETLEVELAVGPARQTTDHEDVEGGEDGSRCIEAGGGIVVAPHHHDVEGGEAPPGPGQEAVPQFLCRGRGVDRFEDVPGMDQCIDPVPFEGIEQPIEKMSVFELPRMLVKGLAKVPVGGVEKAHGQSPSEDTSNHRSIRGVSHDRRSHGVVLVLADACGRMTATRRAPPLLRMILPASQPARCFADRFDRRPPKGFLMSPLLRRPSRPIATPAALLIALLSLPLLTPGAVTAEDPPWLGEPFAAAPAELLAAADHWSEGEAIDLEASVLVLYQGAEYSFDEAGRMTFRRHLIYRPLDQDGLEGWATVGAGWAPWYQDRPTVRARVIAPDGTVRELDESTVVESPTAEISPDIFDDRLELQAPLPGLRIGAVIEELIEVRDREPFFAAGTTDFDYMVSTGHLALGRLVLEAPEELPLRFRVDKSEIEPEESVGEGRRRLVFTVSDVPPVEGPEPGLPYTEAAYPRVSFSTAESWQAVAASYAAVVDRRLEGAELDELLAEVPEGASPRATVDHLLAAVQSRVRYTGLELGAASIVPALPADTLERQFGDCKDKSTLLVGLLRAAGLDASVALLSAGFGTDASPDLPGLGGFNHAIVVVEEPEPGSGQVWIDPTDPYARAGQLPSADQGRLALVARPDSAAPVRIPAAPPEENRIIETRHIELADFGPGRVVETTEYHGVFELYQRAYSDLNGEDRRAGYLDYVQNVYLAEELAAAEETDPNDLSRPFTLTLEVEGAGAAAADLDEAAVGIHYGGLLGELPEPFFSDPEEPRLSAWEMSEPHVIEWRYRISPPKGFAPRDVPEDSEEALGAARLTSRHRFEDGVYSVDLSFHSGPRHLDVESFEATRRALGELAERETEVLIFDHQASVALGAGRPVEALDLLRGLRGEEPEEPFHTIRLSRTLLAVGLGEEARRVARQAVALDAEEAMAHWALGFALSHDPLGRIRQPGYVLDEARSALERAAELDPENALVGAELAILLDFDADGTRYGPGADLERAIETYRGWREDFDSPSLDPNLMSSLFHAERWQELLDFTDEQPAGDVESNAWRLTCLAILEGPERALREAGRLGSDRDTQATLLANAAQKLLLARHYPAAAAVMRQAASISANPAAALQFAEVIGRVRKLEELELATDDPASVFQRMLMLFADPQSPAEGLHQLLHPDVAGLEGFEDDSELDQALEVMRRQLAQSSDGTPMKVAIELALAIFEIDRQGDESLGYRLRFAADVPTRGQAELVAFVRRFDGGYRLVGTTDDPVPMALEVLRRLEGDDLAGARQWLDWMREGETLVESNDPLGGHPFPRLWRRGQEGDAKTIERAAAALLATGNYRTGEAVPLLEKALKAHAGSGVDGSAPQGERRPLERALALALRGAGQWEPLEILSRRLVSEEPGSEFAFRTLVGSLGAQQRLADAAEVARQRREDDPDDTLALQTLARIALSEGRNAEAQEHLATLQELGTDALDATTLNEWAWALLFEAPVPDEALDLAQKAARRSQYGSYAILHTLASTYAAFDHPFEAYRILLQALDQRPDGQPDDPDWLVMGQIAEAYDLGDVARGYYEKLEKPEGDALLTSWELAQRRLAALDAGGGS